MTLDGAILQLQVIAVNAGANYAPENPVENPSVYPFAIAYPVSGRYTGEAYGEAKDFHEIAVEFHCAPRTNLPTAVETAKNMLDQFGHRVLADPTLAGSASTVLGDDGLSYTFGRMVWGDMENIGFKFTIPIKIRTTAVST